MVPKLRTLAPLLFGVLLLLLFAAGVNVSRVAAVGEPTSAHVESAATVTLFAATPITATGVTYTTAAPNTTDGARDASLVENWATADVFITLDGSGSFTLTATVQFSADGDNWATADYEYATSSAVATQSYARTMTADGAEYMRVPVAGRYMRMALSSTGAVTPTVHVTYRN